MLQVTALLGIEEATLRRWEALGLVRSHDDQFDFQDLVSLRSIVSLIKAGVSPQTISRSMRQLASVLPGTDRPLAQLKIVAEDSGTLLAEIDGSLVTVAGQFLMPFESRNVETSKRPNVRAPIGGVSATATSAGMPVPALDVWTLGRLDVSLMERSADEWFDIASDHEEAGQPAEAIAAYRHALAARPAFPQANFNLANVLRAAGRLEGAEERFRIAIEQNPQMAEAWFNLADLLDQQGRLHEAIACLRTAARCAAWCA